MSFQWDFVDFPSSRQASSETNEDTHSSLLLLESSSLDLIPPTEMARLSITSSINPYSSHNSLLFLNKFHATLPVTWSYWFHCTLFPHIALNMVITWGSVNTHRVIREGLCDHLLRLFCQYDAFSAGLKCCINSWFFFIPYC